MIIRLRYHRIGDQVLCRVFTATAKPQTGTKAGEFIIPASDWDAVRATLHTCEFIEEDRNGLAVEPV